MPDRRPLSLLTGATGIGADPHPPLDSTLAQQPGQTLLGQLPFPELGPGLKLGGRALMDWLGDTVETKAGLGLPKLLRLTSYNPEAEEAAEALRFHGVDKGQPFDVSPEDFDKLVKSGTLERQGAAANQGPIGGMVTRLLSMLK